MTDPRYAPVRVSTADLPERNRVAVWRELYGLTVEIEPAKDTRFECALVSRALPGLKLLLAEMSAVRVVRTREFIADGSDDLILLINQTGALTVSARGCEVVLREGDAVLLSSSDVKVCQRHTPGGSFSLRVPRSVLASMVIDVDDAVMKYIPRDADVLRLLTGYAGGLLEEDTLLLPALRRSVVTHVHDLVALALGATRETADVAKDRGMGAVRLRSAKSYIAKNSHRQNLAIGTVAAHLRVTPRYLQKLFESEGGTFSEYLRHLRLARAHRMLTEPRFAQSAVGTVAYEVGFSDLSYFNRSFKQRYGITPSDVREAAVS